MRAIVYARLSMQNEDVTSITRQVAQCTAEAKRRNREPVVFCESTEGHHSGKSESNRPEFQKAMQMIESARDVDTFIVADSSRAWRNARRYLEFRERLESKSIQYVSLMEPHLSADMPQSSRRFITGISAAASQFYADFISDKMRTHTAYVKELGGTWGNPPCGLRPVGRGVARHYEKSDETYELNGVTHTYLETVEAMLRLYVASELGSYELVKRLTEYRWKGHDGKPHPVSPANFWHFKNVAKYYRGVIDDDLLDLYQEKRMRRTQHNNSGRAIQHDPPLMWGLVFCPVCGGRFVIKRSDRQGYGHVYYRHTTQRICANYHLIPCRKLDERIYNYLSEFLDLPEAQKKRIIEQAATPRPDKSRAKRERIESKLANLKVMRVDGELSPAEYRTWKAKLESELAKLPEPGTVVTVSAAEMQRRLAAPVATIRNAPAVVRNQAMRGLFVHVFAWKSGKVKVELQEWVRPMFDGRDTL